MISASLWEMIKCRWREFLREPSAFFWVVFMPVLWMIVLGLAFNNPKPDLHGIGILAEQDDEKIFEILKKHEQVKLRVGTESDLKIWLQRGEIVLTAASLEKRIVYSFDPSNPEAKRAKYFIDTILQEEAGRKNPVLTSDNPITRLGGRYIDFLIPGLIGLSIMSSSLFGTGMTIVSNRRENLLKRYLATPMRKIEFLFSHVVGRLIVLVTEFSAILIAGALIFDFSVFGTLPELFIICVLGASAFTGIALVCGSRIKNVPMMAGIVNLISIPLMMLSGVFFSKSNFPDGMIQFINYLPLTALNDALRKVALEGQHLTDLTFELTVMAVFTVVSLITSKVLFRWY